MTERTVAVIVRSANVGEFLRGRYDLAEGTVELTPARAGSVPARLTVVAGAGEAVETLGVAVQDRRGIRRGQVGLLVQLLDLLSASLLGDLVREVGGEDERRRAEQPDGRSEAELVAFAPDEDAPGVDVRHQVLADLLAGRDAAEAAVVVELAEAGPRRVEPLEAR